MGRGCVRYVLAIAGGVGRVSIESTGEARGLAYNAMLLRETDAPESQDGRRGPRVVLVIEDTADFREVLAETLHAWGYRAIQAGDGEAGLHVFRAHAPDLVLCDLRMPKLDGLQVLAAIKQERPDTAVIMITGAGSMNDALQALRLGAWDFILKPIELEAVRHSVARAFERMDLLRENQRYRQSLEETVAHRTQELRRRHRELMEINQALTHEVRERRRAEDERAHLEAELRQAQKMEAIGTLASGVAHDFNNLLTAIVGNLMLLKEDETSERAQRYILEAEKACMRATGLVRQMLALSRRTAPDMAPTDLNRIVDEVHRLVRETFDRRIEFFVDKAENLPSVLGDPTHLNSLLLNLVVNARDAVLDRLQEQEDAAVPVPARITVRTREHWLDKPQLPQHAPSGPGWYVILSVADTGTGMSEEVRTRIFEPFFTTKAVEKGTGLGLAVVYGIVQQQGGWISVDTAPNEGSTFTLYLPVAHRHEPRHTMDTPAHRPVQGGTETLLLVDDEPAIRDIGCEYLARLGYNVLLASDGQEGLDKFHEQGKEVDLLILDLSMPKMSGNEMLRQIRRLSPELKAIVSSGSADAETAVTERVEGFVLKPFRPAELAVKIREVLDT